MDSSFFLKGNICHTPSKDGFEIWENAFLLCDDGRCGGVFPTVPARYSSLPVRDCGDCLIIPGMVDLHIHAPQYSFRGTGMDCELLEWLNTYAFPEESKYADLAYAQKAYGLFADALAKSATTRAVIFATVHRGATFCLMELMAQTGLVSCVGKVSMDRNAPPELTETGGDSAAFFSAACTRTFRRTYPILTPRFIPSCSDSLLTELSALRRAFDLPVQSHLSENPGEVELVRQLMPDAAFYGDGYDRYGLFGGEARTVMAHCIYSTEAEVQRLRDNGVWVAHCPNSNMNVSSGIAPIRSYLDRGLRVGLGSDVAGGQTESMFRAITDAIQVSKLYWRLVDQKAKPLSFSESFYLATRGGGSFFGEVGSFEPGFEFDAVVLDDAACPHPQPLSVQDRLERAVYLGLDRDCIRAKYVRGEKTI